MCINVSTLAAAINEKRHITPEELAKDGHQVVNHWKVYFDISGKASPFTWFCFASDYAAAKQAASAFLAEELAKGFYPSGKILSIKQI